MLVFAASCLFFFDVLLRRVAVSFSWAPRVAITARDWVLRRKPAAAPSEYMDRLRSRKAEIAERLEQERAGARYEPTGDLSQVDPALEPGQPQKPAIEPEPAAVATAALPAEESYTSRLLKAKKQVWDGNQGRPR